VTDRAAAYAGLALVAAASLAVAGCNKEPALPDEVKTTPSPRPSTTTVATGGAAATDLQHGKVTPMAERVATLGLLNKRNNLSQDITLRPGESKRIDNVIVKLSACERTAPWEDPPETGAFVQVFVEERATVRERLAWHKVFSGWLFKNAPALNVVQHPVYDVWVKACAMNFPGEEAKPAAAASASSAAKPAGKSATPTPAPSPSARPSPAPSPAASADAARTDGNPTGR
jgi:hypothetical protein